MPTIYQLPTQQPAMVGVYPNFKYAVFGDNLATITTAGYLNQVNLESNPISKTDIVQVLYSYNPVTQAGTYGTFTVTISNSGVITLNSWANPGDVTLPVVSGDFANFTGTTGTIADLGFSPTDATKTKVVMLNAAPTINHAAIFTNANGTIGDGGVLGTAAAKAASDNTKPNLASVTAATTSGNLAQFNDTAGTIGDSSLAITNVMVKNAGNQMSSTGIISLFKANGTEAANAVTASGQAGQITTSALTTVGGSSYAITWTNLEINTTSGVCVTLGGGSNTTKDITLECVVGSASATLTIYNNTAATSLNGTIIINYLVL